MMTLCVCLFGGTVVAHELWIDTPDFTPATQDPIEIELRNGEMLRGINLSYFETRVERLFYDNGTETAAQSRMGDMPAMIVPPQHDGLLRVVYVSTPSTISYAKWDKFVAFTDHKDAAWVQDVHQSRGFPTQGFKEEYTRYSKALIGVGGAQGADKTYGLEVEITALANPYVDDLSGGLPILVTVQNVPRGDAQVEVFERDAEGVARSFTIRTDSKGRAIVPVSKGKTYLLDSVVLRPMPNQDSRTDGIYWQSHWAALTFQVP